MKIPRKYLNHFGIVGMEDLLSEMIKEVQKDAYNQAIDDAAKNAQSIIFTRNGKKSAAVKSNSILKLKIK